MKKLHGWTQSCGQAGLCSLQFSAFTKLLDSCSWKPQSLVQPFSPAQFRESERSSISRKATSCAARRTLQMTSRALRGHCGGSGVGQDGWLLGWECLKENVCLGLFLGTSASSPSAYTSREQSEKTGLNMKAGPARATQTVF